MMESMLVAISGLNERCALLGHLQVSYCPGTKALIHLFFDNSQQIQYILADLDLGSRLLFHCPSEWANFFAQG
jgi:hypothetical protein